MVRIAEVARSSARAAFGLALVAGTLAALGACSWLHFGDTFGGDETYDYRKAKPRQGPLDVPPDLTPLPKEERVVAGSGAAKPGASAAAAAAAPAAAPAAGALAPAATVAVAPAAPVAVAAAPASSAVNVAVLNQMVAPAIPGARIVREGGQRYLAVDVSPETAYATVKDLWAGLGMKIEVDEPRQGILETNWAENHPQVSEDAVRNSLHRILGSFDSTGERNRYRARIERTANNTAEITITHRGLEEVYTSPMRDNTAWQPRPPDPDLEAQMLQRLALRFMPVQAVQVAVAPGTGAATQAAAPAPVSAPVSVPAPAGHALETASVQNARVHKVTAGGIVTLQVEDSVEHTWRQVGNALDRGGFTVQERNRDQHIFTVRYLDPDYEISEREKRSWWDRVFNSDAKIPEQQFQIAIGANGPSTSIEVRDRDGRPDAGPTARRILDQLTEQMR